jgi:hypothetical protein
MLACPPFRYNQKDKGQYTKQIDRHFANPIAKCKHVIQFFWNGNDYVDYGQQAVDAGSDFYFI